MGTQATRDTPLTPVLRAMDIQATQDGAYPASPGYGYQNRPLYSPYSGSGYGYPVAGYPGDRLLEEWSPGSEYNVEPSS